MNATDFSTMTPEQFKAWSDAQRARLIAAPKPENLPDASVPGWRHRSNA